MATIGSSITISAVGPGGTREIGFSNFFVVGQTPWGIDGAWTVCTSFQDFLRQFGGLNKIASVASGTTLSTYTTESSSSVTSPYYAVKAYFQEKQSNSPGVLYFCRAVASTSGPTAGSLTVSDGATHNTTITSKWKGMAGNDTQVTVTNPSPTAGTGYAQFKIYHPQANITEYWDIANANDAANASKKSQLVTIALPVGGQLPQTAATAKINTGTPGTADTYAATDPDLVGTTTAAGVKTGLQVFNDQKLGSGFVAIPGKYTSTIRTGIATHCATYYRMGLLGAPSGLNLTTVVSDLSTTNGADLAYYWPQLWTQDDGSTQGGQVLVDNVGHIAGLHARMDRDYGGPQKSAAGITHPITSAIDVERATGSFMELCDDSGSNLLADSLINTVRVKGNPGGIVSWGMRTLSQDNRYRQVPVRRILHLIYLTTFLTLETYTFEPFDPQGRLFSKVRGDLNMFLEGLLRKGTLYGNSPGKDPRSDDAYYVVCDKSNNPGTQIANGELHVDVQFVPAFNAEKVSENLSLVIPGFVGRSQ